jgi:redox-sensitive bicupin YhaK (pirin superfamily)
LEQHLVLHTAQSRGQAHHGWLDSFHTFSFANYYDPQRLQFGALRVLNDDTIQGGNGFGMHAHNNMEIITIPLEGALEHRDSMGNKGIIHKGDIQVMSAGTGIQHSEYNALSDRPTQFLQIWLTPHTQQVPPRYDQYNILEHALPNQWQQILSPHKEDAGVWIHQDAWFYIGTFDAQKALSYTLHDPHNGVYAFVIKGRFEIQDQALDTRDGLGIWDVEHVQCVALAPQSELLLMEIPMSV